MNVKTIWNSFVSKLPKRKKADEEDDRSIFSKHFEKIFLFIVIMLLVVLIYSLKTYDYKSITLPAWALDAIKSIWFWIILVAVLLFLFRRKILAIFKDTPGSTNKGTFQTWLRVLLTLAIVALLIWFVIPHMRHWNWFSTSHDHTAPVATNDKAMEVITSSPKRYSKLNMSGSNDMKKGVWKKFSIRRDGDPIWFTPAIAQGDTLTYYFKKVEDETRSWAVQAWIGTDGNPVEKHITEDEPYPEAQLGECLVSTNKDVVVVVKVKKKN